MRLHKNLFMKLSHRFRLYSNIHHVHITVVCRIYYMYAQKKNRIYLYIYIEIDKLF